MRQRTTSRHPHLVEPPAIVLLRRSALACAPARPDPSLIRALGRVLVVGDVEALDFLPATGLPAEVAACVVAAWDELEALRTRSCSSIPIDHLAVRLARSLERADDPGCVGRRPGGCRRPSAGAGGAS